ncbi:MAG: hypothetical protein OEM41_00525 [Ignavibacteria bacterium]|nr:hypothetical protein [Ignavibacteria bacterium]
MAQKQISSRMRAAAVSEAEHLLTIYEGAEQLPLCLEVVRQQFTVIQARSQLLLTLSTLALTITGFSGPRIAQTNAFARYSMALGIVFVLVAIIVLLIGSLRIRWITQFEERDPYEMLTRVIQYRDQKTRLYSWELTLLGIGLTSYVASVVTYLLVGT